MSTRIPRTTINFAPGKVEHTCMERRFDPTPEKATRRQPRQGRGSLKYVPTWIEPSDIVATLRLEMDKIVE